MASNFGRKLYTNFWETANPLFGRAFRMNRLPFICDTTNSTQHSCGFLFKRQVKKASSLPPRRTTQITRRFASGSFFALGVSPSSSAVETGATCAISPEKIIPHRSYHFDRRLLRNLAGSAWRRGLHTNKDERLRTETSKDPSFKTDSNKSGSHSLDQTKDGVHEDTSKTEKPTHGPLRGQLNRHFMDRLPHMSHLHRPTKEELLAAATGFWSRLKVRFKWFSIRSVRPFNLDEITALFSWVLLGHVVWIVLGTTTFFSLLILAINTVFAQGRLKDLLLARICSAAKKLRRNFGWLDRQLSYEIVWCEGCFRVCNRAKMEGWCDHLQKCVCFPASWTGNREC